MDVNPWEKKRKVMEEYDESAALYDVRFNDEQTRKYETTLKMIRIAHNHMVLDAGCGTGLLIEHVAKLARLIIGIDFSRQMIKLSKCKLYNLNNVELIRADVDYLPFRNRIFDQVFAITLLQNLPEPIKSLKEISRVTKINGNLVVTGLKKNFTRRDFTKMMKKVGLETIIFINRSEELKDYIGIYKLGLI
ncbi:MAG: class I SAM-dependent methyltransferase [Candidatus Bathyarchaeia archaeon]